MVLLKKTIPLFLYFFAFSLPMQTRLIIFPAKLNNGYWEFGTFSLYFTDILLIFLFLSAVYFYFWDNSGNKTVKQIDKVWLLLAGLDFFVFLSIFFAIDKTLALYHYIWFLLGLALFWLILNVKYNNLILAYSFLIGVLGQAFLALAQFFQQTTWASSWLGWASHKAGVLGTSVIETGAGRWLRAYGGLDHPNILGGLLVVGIILSLNLMLFTAKKNYLKLTLNYFFILLFAAALFFTFSRTAWLALAISLVLLLVLSILPIKRNLNKKNLAKAIISILILVFILAGLYHNIIFTRWQSNGRLELKSNQERLELCQQSFYLIKKYFWLGSGIGNYTLAVYHQIDSHKPAWHYQPVHNSFLLVWAEVGLFGFLFFIALFFYVFSLSFFIKKKENLFIVWPLLSSLIIMLSLDHWWWSLHFGLLFFWFVFGLIIKNLKQG